MVEQPGHALGKKMVRWLSPPGLFVTGLDVVLSGPIGVDRACTKLEVDDEFIEPRRPLSPHLIEAQIVIEVAP